MLASISGGTDICSCFALGNPLLPVRQGELQARSQSPRASPHPPPTPLVPSPPPTITWPCPCSGAATTCCCRCRPSASASTRVHSTATPTRPSSASAASWSAAPPSSPRPSASSATMRPSPSTVAPTLRKTARAAPFRRAAPAAAPLGIVLPRPPGGSRGARSLLLSPARRLGLLEALRRPDEPASAATRSPRCSPCPSRASRPAGRVVPRRLRGAHWLGRRVRRGGHPRPLGHDA